MTLKDWFASRKKNNNNINVGEIPITNEDVKKLWKKCSYCQKDIQKKELKKKLYVCPYCDYHFRIGAMERINTLADKNTFEEINSQLKPCNPLEFTDTRPYKERQVEAEQKSNTNEALTTGFCSINGSKVGLAVMDFNYMGGSMGSVVGEKLTRLVESCIEKRLPLIAICSSGGARMQEGILSLMQMAKTSCALARFHEEKLLYISVLGEPTFGGVTASFGTLGDIIIAEKDARIGFAGRRVIEQTIKQKLPSDFQTDQYLLKYGQIDMICARNELKDRLSLLVKMHVPQKVEVFR